MSTRRFYLIAAALIAAGIFATAHLWPTLSLSWDEPYHIEAGLTTLDGDFSRLPIDPPLPRMSMAVPVRLFYESGANALSPRDAYIHKATLARLGVLPYYVLSGMLVLMWSRRLFGPQAGLCSLTLYLLLPVAIAHGSLATTDMAYAATFLAATMAAIAWLERPDWRRALLTGIAVGVMIGTKFSALGQWPAAMLMILLAKGWTEKSFPLRRTHFVDGLLLVLPATVIVLGVIYRCHYADMFQGIYNLLWLSGVKRAMWLFHALNNEPVWYFFPVLYFFKTPLSMHFLSVAGNWRLCAEGKPGARLYPLLAVVGILGFSMFSTINMGLRHVLPIVPLLAIPAGYELWRLWQSGKWWRALAALLLAGQAISFASGYRDPIAYYNIMAWPHPERVEIDSDYDWRQGLILLDEDLAARHIDEAYLCVSQAGPPFAYPFIVRNLGCPSQLPQSGWIVVGRALRLWAPGQFHWLIGYERTADIGTLYDLYYIPPPPR